MMRAGKDYITKGSRKPRKRIVRSKVKKELVMASPNKNKPTLKLR